MNIQKMFRKTVFKVFRNINVLDTGILSNSVIMHIDQISLF